MIKAEITDRELIEHLSKIQKDGMTVFTLDGGRFRGAIYNGTRMVNQMRANHDTGILETLVLGQAELCAALMIPLMKGREHITFRYETDGPCRGFSVEADSSGYVRGHLFDDVIPVDRPLENWDLAPFFGNGTVTITRMSEGMKSPQSGTTEIKYRNIAKDLTWYFAQSEQTNTAFSTGIQFDRQGRVTGAGGMYLQTVPDEGGYVNETAGTGRSAQNDESGKRGSLDAAAEKVERAVSVSPSLGTWYSDGETTNDLLFGLFREFRPSVLIERDVIFNCPCSAEGFAERMRHIGKKDFDDMMENDPDPIEVVCQNCGSVYKISKADLKV